MSNSSEKGSSIIQVGSTGLAKIQNVLRVTDRLVNSYDSVTIGNQEWMTRNLNVSRFRNGDPIPEIQDAEEWARAGRDGEPAWCYYDNDPENGKTYGKLYNWYAVNDPRGLAPHGWQIPENEDWSELEIGFYDGHFIRPEVRKLMAMNEAGGKLKSVGTIEQANGLWKYPNKNATNEFSFSANPSGLRNKKGHFKGKSELCCWWRPEEASKKEAWHRQLDYDSSALWPGSKSKGQGRSVRCIKIPIRKD